MRKDGGPAYPMMSDMCGGMSIRDVFAAHVIHGVLENRPADQEITSPKCLQIAAQIAYQIADAMIAERSKP